MLPLDHTAPAADPLPRSLALGLPRVEPAVLLILATAAGLALLWWLTGGWVFPLDDAYITLHNARVLIDGHDRNYGVSALIGATSLIHLALVAFLSLVLPSEAASYVISCLGILLFLAGLLAMARRQGVPAPEAAMLACSALVITPGQLLNGLETGLVLAAVTWSLIVAASPRPGWKLPIACGLLPFLRPELGVLALVLMGRQIWLRAKVSDPTTRLARIAADAGLALAAGLPWLAWSWLATGAILPGTLAAKQAFFGVDRHELPAALGLAALLIIGGVGPALGSLAFLRRDSLSVAIWAFVGLFALGFALTNPELLAHNDKRYTFALLPVALFALARLALSPGVQTLRAMLAAQALVCALLVPRAFESIWDGQVRVADYRAVSTWAQTHLPAGSRLLIHDAGMIAYASDLPLIDLVGLKSPDSVADHRRWTQPTEGKERFRALDAIARRGGATHTIVLEDEPDRFWGRLVDELRQAGWSVDRLDTSTGDGAYQLYSLTPPATDTLTPDQAPDSAETRRPR